mmetsp:Transcript_58333/g.115635  ORF Transcript_58333/g.115635 Transcript_58333/m.115635 type:complete len:222 (+) Transcript_58333:36-701(+)
MAVSRRPSCADVINASKTLLGRELLSWLCLPLDSRTVARDPSAAACKDSACIALQLSAICSGPLDGRPCMVCLPSAVFPCRLTSAASSRARKSLTSSFACLATASASASTVSGCARKSLTSSFACLATASASALAASSCARSSLISFFACLASAFASACFCMAISSSFESCAFACSVANCACLASANWVANEALSSPDLPLTSDWLLCAFRSLCAGRLFSM